MLWSEYLPLALKTVREDLQYWNRDDDDETRRSLASMAALGLVGELGELVKTGDQIAYLDELGDVAWYLALLCKIFDVEVTFDDSKNFFSQTLALHEAAHVCEKVKKMAFHGKEVDITIHLQKLAWFMLTYVTEEQFFEKVLPDNVEKLKQRYPDGFNL